MYLRNWAVPRIGRKESATRPRWPQMASESSRDDLEKAMKAARSVRVVRSVPGMALVDDAARSARASLEVVEERRTLHSLIA